MRPVLTVLTCLLPCAAAAADVRQAADAVLQAVRSDDPADLEALARKDDPDPWLVAEELCRRGVPDAAAAFAQAAPHRAVEKLPDYVASRRDRPPPESAYAAVAAAKRVLRDEEPAEALAALRGLAPGAGVVAVEAGFVRAEALRALSRPAESEAAYLRAAEHAERIGWLARAASALRRAGVIAHARSDLRAAVRAWERALALEESLGRRASAARILQALGTVHYTLGDRRKSLDRQKRALALFQELGDRSGVAASLINIGSCYDALGDLAAARQHLEEGLEEAESIGHRKWMANASGNLGILYSRLGDFDKALAFLQRALSLEEALGGRLGQALHLGNLGAVYDELGDKAKALECHRRSLALRRELGDRRGVGVVLANLGAVYRAMGDYPRALEHYRRSLRIDEELGDQPGMATTLGNIGVVHADRGDFPQALDYLARALRMKEAVGDRVGVARTLSVIGSTYKHLGHRATALAFGRRALGLMEQIGDVRGVATTLGNIGNLHYALNDRDKALAYHERSLALMQETGDREGVARTLASMASVLADGGSLERAQELYERSLKMERELDHPAGVAGCLSNLALVHSDRGEHAAALDLLDRALELSEEMGLRADAAAVLTNRALVKRRARDESAVADYERAGAVAVELGAVAVAARSFRGLAIAHLESGRPAEAAAAARRGTEQLPRLVGRLGEEQGARARERWEGLYQAGILAGRRLEDPREVFFFMEGGRAAVLLEALGGRDALRDVAVPDALRREDLLARAAVRAARGAYERARRGGNRKRIRAARAALDRAREQVLDVVARIRRAAKAAVDLSYPEPARLAAARAVLRADEALLLYGEAADEAVALVVTKKGARIVPLGPAGTLAEAIAGLSLDDPARDPSSPLARLRRTVVTPLGLDPGIRRLLVSPAGDLAYVPFALLAPDRTVTYVPSATTYRALRAERRAAGEKVLALGDPEYGGRADPRAMRVLRAGTGLAPLPGTRAEATAIGDTVLLGSEASAERLLAAIATRPRWRSVHLACHALVDAERPLLSSLALSGSLLSVHDVLRLRIPADLVVLSACETAKGRVYRTEGVVGFTRAFMLAGAPRVLVSLWKVDDEATRALMVKLYELWNPKGSGKAVPAAGALRRAQRHVASHARWKHPFYWAAWQLWGLPD